MIVSQSFDNGRTWSTPTAVFDTSGTLRIGTFDRSGDSANHKYDYSLLTQTGATTFARSVVSTTSSDPTTGDRWFARTVNAGFPFATSFLGDYSNIAVVPGTTTVVSYGRTCATTCPSAAVPPTARTRTSGRPPEHHTGGGPSAAALSKCVSSLTSAK